MTRDPAASFPPDAQSVPFDPRLGEALELVSDAVYVLDRDGRYLFFNRAAEAYFGVSRELVLGRVIWEVFPQGIYELLHPLNDRDHPTSLFIAENGAAYRDGPAAPAQAPSTNGDGADGRAHVERVEEPGEAGAPAPTVDDVIDLRAPEAVPAATPAAEPEAEPVPAHMSPAEWLRHSLRR